VVDGVANVRTALGSAHGRGRKRYRVKARHARLAIHSAHTLVLFLIETWDARSFTREGDTISTPTPNRMR
jgi:hypothetical protein